VANDIVDIHSHIYPRWYLDLLAERKDAPRVDRGPGGERLVLFPSETAVGRGGGRPLGDEFWDLARKLAFMNRFGIGRSVLSLGNPWLDIFDEPTSRELADRVNRELAEIQSGSGSRFGSLGVLPAGVGDAAPAIRRIIALELRGIVTGTRPCGRLLDDPELEVVWNAAEAAGLPILIHPHYGVGMAEMGGLGHAGPVALAFPFETTVAAMRLATAGVLARHPRLQVILSHGGGALPFLIGRVDAAWRSDSSQQTRLTHEPSEDLKRGTLDAVLFDPAAMTAAAALVGSSRLAFGTDHPFSIADPGRTLSAVDAAFGADERREVLAGTANRLFGLSDRSH
jgi:aminocarboxymuconate-semialdehyde decarboxylase